MNEVIESLRRLIPSRAKRTGIGWITFNCPACGDRRGRGGLLETSTGGFRYRCQNGGCRYEQPTGWEPDNGFMGRPRRLFEIMGGDISDIPEELVSPRRRKKFAMDDEEQRRLWISQMQTEWSPEAAEAALWKPPREDADVALEFPEAKLPREVRLLWEATTTDGLDAQRYAINRCPFFYGRAPLLWSPRYKRHVIIPFINRRKIVGWIARKIDDDGEFTHIKCPQFPTDYMLNQDKRFEYRSVLVMQGAFDALALSGLCTFGSVISKKQVNLLKQLAHAGRNIVLIPDFKGQEWLNYLHTAREHGWHVSVPEKWGGSDNESPEDYIKDPGDSIKRHGLLYTVEMVMKSTTNDYGTAEATLLMRSR